MDGNIIDLDSALERVQDDMELLLELFDIFEEDFKKKRKQMDVYLKDQHHDMLRDVAHSLKGAAGNISAERVYAICLFLEKEASEQRLDSFPEKFQELDAAFVDYKKEAAAIRERYQAF